MNIIQNHLLQLKQCPHCQKMWNKSYRLSKLKGIYFCQYCQHSVIKDYDYFDKKINKKIKNHFKMLMITCCYFILLYVMYYQIWFNVLNLVLLMLVLILLAILPFLLPKLKKGVDHLEQVKQDQGEYYRVMSSDLQHRYCLNCHSQRLNDVYWYQKNRILSLSNHQSLPKINMQNDGKHFACLHCHQQYQVVISWKDRIYVIYFLASLLLLQHLYRLIPILPSPVPIPLFLFGIAVVFSYTTYYIGHQRVIIRQLNEPDDLKSLSS